MKKNPFLVIAFLIMLLLAGCSSSQKKFESDAYQVAISGYSDGTCDVSVDGWKYINRKKSDGYYSVRDDVISLDCRIIKSDKTGSLFVHISGQLKTDERLIISEMDAYMAVYAYLRGAAIGGRFTPINHVTPLFQQLAIDLYEYKILYDPNTEPPLVITGLGRRNDRP